MRRIFRIRLVNLVLTTSRHVGWQGKWRLGDGVAKRGRLVRLQTMVEGCTGGVRLPSGDRRRIRSSRRGRPWLVMSRPERSGLTRRWWPRRKGSGMDSLDK